MYFLGEPNIYTQAIKNKESPLAWKKKKAEEKKKRKDVVEGKGQRTLSIGASLQGEGTEKNIEVFRN